MTRWRFVHAADLHLDSPFVGLADYHPELAQELVEATFASFRGLIDLCLQSEAAFLLLAGDLFDGPQRSLKAQLRLREQLARLADAGIETFIVHGNHDYLGSTGINLEWPNGVTVFPASGVEMAEVRRGGETLARIYGLSHAGPSETANLTERFPVAEHGPFSLGLLHANLDRNPEHENYAPCSLADLARVSYDYWALGHIHRPSVRRPSQPAVVYAGNPQGRHLKESGLRGCYVVEVDGHAVSPQFHPLGVIRWEGMAVDISGREGMDQLLGQLANLLEEQRPAPPAHGVILRLSLKGRGPVHRELKLPGTLEEVLEVLREQGRGQSPWVWPEGLEAATGLDWDLPALRQGSDLVATLLEQLHQARQAQEMPREMQELLAPLYQHPSGRRYLTPLLDLPWQDLLDRVTEELLGRLRGGPE
ncbi:MAG: DNA repair exonuclease [Thermodesulfobacteriota bacterium]